MTSTMILHNPKFDAKLTTLPALEAMDRPMPLGQRHSPIPHHVLIKSLLHEVEQRGYMPVRTQFALGAQGGALFGVIEMEPTQAGLALMGHTERRMALGFRNSTDQSMAIQGVAGTRVFVCDNMALAGDTFAFRRKNTTGLDLMAIIAVGFDRFLRYSKAFDVNIERMAAQRVTDLRAKAIIYDVFTRGIVPVRLLSAVHEFYFSPRQDMTDCTPRSEWGVHNAFTRAMKDMPPVAQFRATQQLGKAFHLLGEQAIDAEYRLSA